MNKPATAGIAYIEAAASTVAEYSTAERFARTAGCVVLESNMMRELAHWISARTY